jgi:hypothetical protein
MGGTRKMEKFELDAYEGARKSGKGGTTPAEDAAATGESADAGVGLPARPFEPLTGDSLLPARPFEPRTRDSLLPARPFEPITDSTLLPSSPYSRNPGPPEDPAASVETVPPPPLPAAEDGAWIPGEWVPPQQADVVGGASVPAEEPSSPSNAEGDKDLVALRTQLAQKFVTLADSVTEAFKDFSIGAGAWGVELTAPTGMSTGGGKQALQHLRLRGRRDGYAILVGGTVNQLESRADLRDFDHIAILYEVRYRHALEISPQEWEQFLRKAEIVLNAAGIQSMRTPPPRELLEQRRSMQRISKSAVVALVVVVLLAALVVWRVIVTLLG